MKKLITSALAALTLMTFAGSASALSFRFEFSGSEFVQGGNGSFSVLVEGLSDNTANQAASSVTIESFIFGDGSAGNLSLLPEGPVATSWTNVGDNSFTVSGGVVTAYDFDSLTPVAVGLPRSNLLFRADPANAIFPDGLLTVTDSTNASVFDLFASATPTISSVSAVPLPAPILMLLSALAGLGILARAKGRRNAFAALNNRVA